MQPEEWSGLKAFRLEPRLFRRYARWKRVTNATVVRRQPLLLDGRVVGLMVFFKIPARAV